MEQLNGTLFSAAFAISIFGGVHDLFTRRIPNWLTFPAVGLGLAAQLWLSGWPGLLDGVLGMLLGFVLFFPIHVLGHMGAGDVKLQMAVGTWMGWKLCLYVAFGAVILGGFYALLEVIFRGRMRVVFRNGYSFIRSLLVPGLEIEKLKIDEKRKFAFGICIAGAVAGVTYLRHVGSLL